MLSFAFVLYLIPGLFGAPLKLISGFPPPDFYTEGWKLGGQPSSCSTPQQTEVIPGADPEHCPHGINCFHDYFLALQYAQKVKKPLLVDFTGWSCVNCRKMEDKVWSDPRVLSFLKNEVVLVSLYVDDKTPLPDSLQYVSPITGKKIKTVGNRWSDFQITRFNTNSQPYYVMLDNDEQLLTEPEVYNPSVDNFLLFLQKGKKNFLKKLT